MTADNPLADYEAYLRLKGASPRTIELYLHYLGHLFQFLKVEPAMDRQLHKHVKKAGLKKKVTPHTLRHSAAVHYLMGGAPISFMQDLLGHENLATMGIHTQLADEMMNEVTLSVRTAIEAIKEGKVVREREARYAVRWARGEVGVWRVVT